MRRSLLLVLIMTCGHGLELGLLAAVRQVRSGEVAVAGVKSPAAAVSTDEWVSGNIIKDSLWSPSERGSRMIRPSQADVVRVAALAFRNIPLASAVVVLLSALQSTGPVDMPASFDPVVCAAYVESAFQVVRRAQLKVAVSASTLLPPPSDGSQIELWRKILDATEDIEGFVEGWFVDEQTSVDSLSRVEVEDWIGRNTFGKTRDALTSDELRDVAQMRRELEVALGRRLSKSTGLPARSMAPVVDPVEARQHPLLMYAVLAVVRRSYRRKLFELGFRRTVTKHMAYWVRPGTAKGKTALVFAHGIGVGLAPYANLVDRLACVDPTRPLVLLELPSISTHLASPPLAGGAILAAEVAAALASINKNACVLVAHSFGSTLAAFLAKYRPSVLAGLVLIEPVCFLLNLPKTTKRVFYQRDADPVLRLVATDPGNALSLRRSFWWQEGLLLADSLQGLLRAPSAVFLAENDKIVPTADVAKYIARYARPSARRPRPLPLKVYCFAQAGHGEWQGNMDHIDRVVAAAHDAARVLDTNKNPRFTLRSRFFRPRLLQRRIVVSIRRSSRALSLNKVAA